MLVRTPHAGQAAGRGARLAGDPDRIFPFACHPGEQRLLVKRLGQRAGIAEVAAEGRDLGADGGATPRPAQPDLQYGGREQRPGPQRRWRRAGFQRLSQPTEPLGVKPARHPRTPRRDRGHERAVWHLTQ